MRRRYSVKGSVRKTFEFVALSVVFGGDIHYDRWPERQTFLTMRTKPVPKKKRRR